jgi:hypothetical protein
MDFDALAARVDEGEVDFGEFIVGLAFVELFLDAAAAFDGVCEVAFELLVGAFTVRMEQLDYAGRGLVDGGLVAPLEARPEPRALLHRCEVVAVLKEMVEGFGHVVGDEAVLLREAGCPRWRGFPSRAGRGGSDESPRGRTRIGRGLKRSCFARAGRSRRWNRQCCR